MIAPEDIRHARRAGRKLGRRLGMAPEDAVGVALLALVEAAATFDPGRGVRLSSHAFWRIRGALIDQSYKDRGSYRLGSDGRARVFPRYPVDLDSALLSEPMCFADRSPAPDEVAAAREQLAAVNERLAELKDTKDIKRRALRRYFVDGLSAAEVGQRMGLTESRVCQIVREARAALAEMSS